MPRIQVETVIKAPASLCFDLARDVRIHIETAGNTRERVLEAPGSGILELGDIVTFEAVHFGIRQRLSSRIVAYDRPKEFVDEMEKDAFRRLRHIHQFEDREGTTTMIDQLDFESPFGWIGRLFDALILTHYLRRFLVRRGKALCELAEKF